MKQLTFILSLLCLGFFHLSIAQIENDAEENIIENTVNNVEEDFDNENIIEDLLLIKRYPFNVNDTLNNDYSVLFQYGLMTPEQEFDIRKYIQQYGELKTSKELLAIPNLTIEQANRLQPYFTVEKKEEQHVSFIDQIKHGKNTLIIRDQFTLEDQKGFKEIDDNPAKYAGNKHRLYFKYRHQYRDKMSFGVLGDKDAGEDFLKGSNKSGFDFYSAHFGIKPNSKIVKEVIVGDYEVKVGQGLIQWNGFALGKGANATTVFLKSPIIRPYTSSNELNYMRGATAQFQLNDKITSTVWGSYKTIDANQTTDSLDNNVVNTYISSIQTSGLHRTEGEIADERISNELIGGANIAYENSWLKVGATGQMTKLKDSLSYRGQDYQAFYPTGTDFFNGGIHYTAVRNRTYLFGETAVNQDGSFATVNGIQRFFNSGIKGTLVYRNYSKGYTSQYASALSEGTRVNNEQGVYVGLSYSPYRFLTLQAYADYFKFPWKRFGVSSPTNGTELFFNALYQPKRSTALEFRSKLEEKPVNLTGTSAPTNELHVQKRYNNRLELRYKPNKQLYLKSRIGHSYYTNSLKNENGFLLFQDAVYQLKNEKVKLYGRLALFNTPSYDTRVYAYENDLLYNFSVPAYYGEGTRYYGMVSFAPSRDMKFWLKASQTNFNDRDIISSGNAEIDSNKRTDVKLQVQYKF